MFFHQISGVLDPHFSFILVFQSIIPEVFIFTVLYFTYLAYNFL